VRWESPEFGSVSPVRFIPLAEETGMILPITDFVLRNACREAASWSARGLCAEAGRLNVAVNLSARQFRNEDLADSVRRALDASGLPPHLLELEITEGLLMHDPQGAADILNGLRAMGIKIALDDFGTGYSSLAYLKTFPLDRLKLDRAFYTADDPGIAREAISRIRVATIQVYRRPTLVIDAIRKLSLKALYLPDRKRILLDGDLPLKKHRWNEAHEIGHSLVPWHEGTMLGDNAHTLSPDCREQVEAEANFAAGRLLFLRERFATESQGLDLAIASVQQLHGRFGNTLSTTLYRFIEVAGNERPMVGLITCHPHVTRRPADHDPAKPCRHFIQSPAFAARFGRMPEADVFRAVASYCGPQGGGPLGTAELVLRDDNGDRHRFNFETFYNRYDALTLGVYVRPEMRVVPIST